MKRTTRLTVRVWVLALSLTGCVTQPEPFKIHMLQQSRFGQTRDGIAVDLYTLQNRHGMRCKIITYGAIVTELHVPDRRGRMGDVVLGFDTLEGYLKGHPYFGAVIGRVANRIARGTFSLNGRPYTLATNNGPNHLHGGLKGLDKVVWTAESLQLKSGVGLKLRHRSADGEEGYPGNLEIEVTYTLTDQNELRLDYAARTDQDTPVNLSNHSYFNLAGPEHGDILQHTVQINADRFTPTDDTLIPTGEIKPVAGTPLDFRQPTAIGARLAQIGATPAGYDHNFVLNGGGGSQPVLAARVSDPGSGRVMDVLTTEPGVQFYTGNFLDGTLQGKHGAVYRQHQAFCLETQHFPDSVNHSHFPTVILQPGQTYRQTTIYRFSTGR